MERMKERTNRWAKAAENMQPHLGAVLKQALTQQWDKIHQMYQNSPAAFTQAQLLQMLQPFLLAPCAEESRIRAKRDKETKSTMAPASKEIQQKMKNAMGTWATTDKQKV